MCARARVVNVAGGFVRSVICCNFSRFPGRLSLDVCFLDALHCLASAVCSFRWTTEGFVFSILYSARSGCHRESGRFYGP